MKVVIAGAGIGGLTLALAAKQAGMVPIVVERKDSISGHTFGGGIGLWPPSQKVFQQLGILNKL
jgi:2-polyprenyl-6-methoxyphenol hydroxylase-like FAD-dependent oxidoreductase